ncbi:uncharacterized protein LOC121371453 isoform X2 [Gigantopelta aegis]|nr:uncharacterized protein LOC121371453 isoform X2 [Gigantopelta aegis]
MTTISTSIRITKQCPHHLTLILVLMFVKVTGPGKLKPKKYYKHIGCYVESFRPDGVRPWFFHDQYHPMIVSSLSTCLLHCLTHKFFYVAVDKENCGCANNLTNEKGEIKKTNVTECSYVCTEEPFVNVSCGAKNRQSVYEIAHSSILHVYVGCYHLHPLDASMAWVPLIKNSPFSHEFTKMQDGKASHCIKHCSKSGFKYAAIFAGQNCGCDHVIKRKTKKISNMYCTYPCLDLKLGTCGALKNDIISIYLSNEVGIKWMKRAIDTGFLIKELNIKDHNVNGSKMSNGANTETDGRNITNSAKNETKKTEEKILGIKLEIFIGGSVGIGLFLIGLIVGICCLIK